MHVLKIKGGVSPASPPKSTPMGANEMSEEQTALWLSDRRRGDGGTAAVPRCRKEQKVVPLLLQEMSIEGISNIFRINMCQ